MRQSITLFVNLGVYMFFWYLQACLPDLVDPAQVQVLDNPYHDWDGDGVSDLDGDCDDNNPDIVEPREYYKDTDGDGFVERYSLQSICSSDPEGNWVVLGQQLGFDCDDENALVNPDAFDSCNGLDDDCNGTVDDGRDETTPWWYRDADGDGYGQPIVYADDGTIENDEFVYQGCSSVDGYVRDNTDCDDTDPLNYPGNPEVCDGQDNNCNGTADELGALGSQSWSPDLDGDGFATNETIVIQCEPPNVNWVETPEGADHVDCDDTDSTVSPIGVEECNDADDNCDGLIDNDAQIGLLTCYLDRDGDGFGDDLSISEVCSCPLGSVQVGGDCDDTSASISPSAVEICNGADDNCDGVDDNQAIDPTVYYEDVDGDGYGTSVTYLSCPDTDSVGNSIPPSGYATMTGDCDDNLAAVNPGQPELCTLLIDENCDGKNVLGAVDYLTYWADADGDGFGNSNNQLEVCTTPVGYIEVDPTALPSEDCDDADNSTFPGATEICNGKLDDCFLDDGTLTVPPDEEDVDEDTFLDCDGKVFDPTLWVGDVAVLTAFVSDGVDRDVYRDCDDGDPTVFPFAFEICDGLFQDCTDTEWGVFASPALERDDDGDGFVECEGFDVNTWQGDSAVIEGLDCDDANSTTYPGAATFPATNECFADDDLDGIADCAIDGTGGWSDCDPEAILDFFGQQMDFALIPAGTVTVGSVGGVEYGRKSGNETQVTVSFSQDWYAMTAEVTQGMYEATSEEHEGIWKEQHEGFIGFGNDKPVYWMSWYKIADFANQVTLRHNLVKGDSLDLCYTCTDSNTVDVVCEESMNPYQCTGYRLPTYTEWEYMAHGDTEDAFWTPDGIGYVPNGTYSLNPIDAVDDCIDTSWVFDDGLLANSTPQDLSSYTLADIAWYCANSGGEVHPIRQKQPNFYGLYDMHGNVQEWTHDYVSGGQSGTDGWLTLTQNGNVDISGDASPSASYRNVKGGNYGMSARNSRIATFGRRGAEGPNMSTGMRLVRSVPNPTQ